MEINRLSKEVIGAAIEVHKALGPGMLESVYQSCLAYELRDRGLNVETEVSIPVIYKELSINDAYRIDMMVEGRVVLELKAVEMVLPVHGAQLLSYLRLARKQLGLLINFNVPVLSKGVKRVVNNL